jgi:hypothetical protein
VLHPAARDEPRIAVVNSGRTTSAHRADLVVPFTDSDLTRPV